MNRLLLIALILLPSCCRMVPQMHEMSYAIHENRMAIEYSSAAIYENAEIVRLSPSSIDDNQIAINDSTEAVKRDVSILNRLTDAMGLPSLPWPIAIIAFIVLSVLLLTIFVWKIERRLNKQP